jgi:signal peptidase I
MPGEWVKVEGGKVKISDDGTTWVKLNEPYIQGSGGQHSKVDVPEGCYFIIGDNRTSGGAIGEEVSKGDITGKAWLIIWPPRDLGLAPNYSHYSYGTAWGLLKEKKPEREIGVEPTTTCLEGCL